MNDHLDIDQAGLDFISRWEGCILHVYRDIAGLKTVGIGHLVTKDEDRLFPDGMKISREQAIELLHKDVQKCVRAIRANIKQPLNQNQFNALCSFAFNCGTGVTQNSGVARAINAGNFSAVRPALLEWCKAKINGVFQVNAGLLARRRSSADLFEKPAAAAIASYEPFSSEEMACIQAQLDISSKANFSYAVLACSEHEDDAESVNDILMCVA